MPVQAAEGDAFLVRGHKGDTPTAIQVAACAKARFNGFTFIRIGNQSRALRLKVHGSMGGRVAPATRPGIGHF